MKRHSLLLTFEIIGFLFPALSFADDVRDVKPPVEYPTFFTPTVCFYIALIVMLILSVVAFIVIRKFWKAKSVRPPKPWVTAYQQLEDLRVATLRVDGEIKEYYTQLSDIVRHYVEERFGIKASDMTTEEFIPYLQKSNVLNWEQEESLEKFLESCDMVKFAQQRTSYSDMEYSIDMIRQLVVDTTIEEEDEEEATNKKGTKGKKKRKKK